MATATGWGALPISLSFGDSIKSLVSELNGPVAKAAKNAGGSIEKEIGNASKKAADQYEKQQWRMEKATKEKTAAEENHRLKLLEQQRAQTALENAEKDLADARESGGKKARDAQLRYEATQIKVEKATIATRKASDKLDGSIDEVSKATESAEQAFKDMEKAQDDTGNSAKSLRDRVREMGEEAGETGGIFEGLGGKIGGALKGLAIGGVASLGAASAGLVKFGSDFDDAFDTIRIGTGASGEAFEDLKESAKSVADSVPAMDGGFGQISSTMADLNTRLGLTGEPLENMTGQFVQLANMGIDADINDVSQALSGFGVEATDAPAALDELFQISQATGLTITELSNSAVKAGPALRGFGFGLGESAALAGQLDKAGLDADKTMTSMTRALTEFASEGRDAPAALQETVDQIDSFIASGDDAAAMDLAAGLFGTRGASQFVDAVKTGTLSVEDLVGATGATSDTIMGVADETADLAESWQLFKQKSMDAIQPVATALFDRLAPALERASDWIFDQLVPAMSDLWEHIQPLVEKGFVVLSDALDTVWRVVSEDLVPTFRRFIGWMKDNREVIQSVAVGAGVLAGGLALMNVQQKILMAGGVIKWMKSWTVATNIQAAAQRLLNTVMKANPIGLIITAVSALAAGLTYFFTKTETGRELWEKFTSFLSDAWQNVSEKFAEGIDWISEKWDSFTSFMGDLWETIKTTVFDAWTNTVQGIRDGWDTFTGAISDAWTWLKDTLVNVWTTVRDAVLGAFEWYINRLKNTFEKVTGALSTAWTWLKDTLVNVWNTIKDAVFNAFNNAIGNVQNIFDRVTGAISDAWTWLKDQLHAVWTWIDDNVLGGFRRGMEGFKSFFEGIVDGIKNVWDTLRSALAKPINFMINTVYNGGILKAWEMIRKFLPGLKEATPLAGIPEHATGGRISGPGTDTSDDVLMWGSNGEHMLTVKEVQRLGGHKHVYAMRQMVESGRPFSFDGRGDLTPLPRNPDNRAGDLYGAAPGLLPAYKDGGEIRPLWEHQLMAAHKFAQSQSGKPYQWAGPTGPGSSFDCSGFMGSIAATIQGDNPWQRYWATGSFPSPGAQGFAPGLGPGFSVGIFNGGPYGGHTAGTLGPAGPYGSVNVESGGAPSRVKYGPGAVGADHSQFTMRYHLPIGADGAFVSGGGGGISPEAMHDGLKKKVSDFVDKAMNPVLSKLPVGPPEWQNIPKNVYDKGKDGMLDTAFDVVGKLGDKLASVWTAAGEIKDLVTGAVGDAASWVNDRVRSIVVRDNGGIVPNGAAAINTSGKDELMLPPSTTALFNKFLKDMPGAAGALERAAVAFQDAAEDLDLSGAARKSAEDYAAEQAGGFLSTWGLEGLVPLAQKAGGMAWDAYVSNPVDVAMTPGGVTAYARKQGVQSEVNRGGATVTIEAESDEDLIRVSQFKQLASQVDWLKVKVERKPKAGARTRGGVM